MNDQTASRSRRVARRLHCHLAHRLRRNIISQRMARSRRRVRSLHLYEMGAALQPLPTHHLTASNIDLDQLTSTLNLFDSGHAKG
ncbi:hypothetical protein [Hyphomicrobium sp. 99]|uniref:hypothetical protein n=1 Tax=Hyphomicrobium sp. 99 TaxID=1163419 RepID=UPI0012E0C01B|nr:hypothetical protein [Hyphomicrobium sp. 99]